jgi:hypothetical protein
MTANLVWLEDSGDGEAATTHVAGADPVAVSDASGVDDFGDRESAEELYLPRVSNVAAAAAVARCGPKEVLRVG